MKKHDYYGWGFTAGAIGDAKIRGFRRRSDAREFARGWKDGDRYATEAALAMELLTEDEIHEILRESAEKAWEANTESTNR